MASMPNSQLQQTPVQPEPDEREPNTDNDRRLTGEGQMDHDFRIAWILSGETARRAVML